MVYWHWPQHDDDDDDERANTQLQATCVVFQTS